MPKLEERELTAILAAEKRDALSADQAAKLSEERERGMDYYNGDMSADMPSQPDRSKAVSTDVLDVVEGLMPGLMEIFAGGDEVVRFNPVSEEDEKAAEQETDYVNHVFLQKNDGFIVSYSFIKDALLSKNGIVKIFWQDEEQEERETFYDQPDDVYALFVADPEVEIVEHTEHPPEYPPPSILPGGGEMPGPAPVPGPPGPGMMAPDIGMAQTPVMGAEPPVGLGAPPMEPPGLPGGPPLRALGGPPGALPPMGGGMPPQAPAEPPPEVLALLAAYGPTHDFTTVTKRKYGCCKVEPVPPEEFGVSRRAKLGQPLDYSYHKVQRTVAELIRQGYDPDQLEDLPDSPPDENSETIARDTIDDDRTFSSSVNRATRLITVTEHYATLDYEDDGKARLYRVTTAGDDDGQVLKRNGELDIIPVDFDPFSVMTPIIVTHRFFGKSMPDLTMDIQRIKTALYRGMLDNVYLANNQRLEISESHAGPNTIDDLLNGRPGGLVRTKTPGGLLPIPNQNLGEYVYPALEYMDTVREWRTGVVRQGVGIDSDALQNQSATAVRQTYNAAQAKMRLNARVMAEVGFKQLFWKMHSVIRKNEGSRPTVKLRGEWVTVDPRQWRKRDDLTISVGLGSGGKAEQAAYWNQILLIQKEALALPGQNIVKPDNIYAVLTKLLAAGGEKSAEPYFSDPSDPANPPGEEKPDPKEAEAQAKLLMQQAQIKADMQKMQADAQLKQMEMQHRIQLEQTQAQADVAANDRKIEADIALAREKFAMERELKMQEFQFEQRLKAQEFQLDEARATREEKTKPSAVSINSNGDKVEVTHSADAIMAPMADAIGNAIAKMNENLDRAQAQNTQLIMQALQGMGHAMGAPKRVVRDPKTNRVVGVETVTNGAAR